MAQELPDHQTGIIGIAGITRAPKGYETPDRQKTHGKFYEYANVAQALKEEMRAGSSWNKMSDAQKEGLDMIAGKIARICTGDPYESDHWVDISGYSQRVVESFSFEGTKKE